MACCCARKNLKFTYLPSSSPAHPLPIQLFVFTCCCIIKLRIVPFSSQPSCAFPVSKFRFAPFSPLSSLSVIYRNDFFRFGCRASHSFISPTPPRAILTTDKLFTQIWHLHCLRPSEPRCAAPRCLVQSTLRRLLWFTPFCWFVSFGRRRLLGSLALDSVCL